MDYTTLVGTKTTDGSIKQWLNDSTVPSAVILGEAEAWIYRRLRVRQMLTRATGTMTQDQDYITLPSDYIHARSLVITGSNAAKLDRKVVEEVVDAYAYDSTGTRISAKPTIYYCEETKAYFDSPALSAYPYLMIYWGQPAALGSGNTTNFLTSRGPRLVRAACMAMGVEFKKEAGQGQFDRTYWLQVAQNEVAELNAESMSEEAGDDLTPIFL